METEWDRGKAARNQLKHGVDFADATQVLEDDLALTLRDPDSQTEERFITMGHDAYGRLLVVVYTWRGERIRLISARTATGAEWRRFEAQP